MLLVEIIPIQDTLVLRARGSELLILPHHVVSLKGHKKPQSFTSYFTSEALLNRPARKLFEAWLRKDNTLWKRIYSTVQEMELSEETQKTASTADEPEKIEEKPVKKTAKKTTKKATKKTEKKATKKATKKTEKKATKKTEKKVAKKTTKKKTTKKKS